MWQGLDSAMMVKSVDILCIQETMWKGSKARKIVDSFKLFYHGDGGRKHRIGVTEGSLLPGRRVLEVNGVPVAAHWCT